MSDSHISTRVIQTVGISTSLILSGVVTACSVIVVPRLLESPTPLLLRQWDNMYEQGKRRVGPLAIIPAFSYLYLAYNEHTAAFPALWKVNAYTTAGFLAAAIGPYTWTVMRPTNAKLKTKAAEASMLNSTDEAVEVATLGTETAHKLLDFWAMLNLGRAAVVASSGVLGVWTALN
ncbi:hypothetical protein OIDMADRAFT_162173 [Oidiodendron maius Zn]|uniref:DUF1772 domain-containing protein n=1 Tax=Oidiodendron maius (strain Zn) TaxID=913774 RepID=A0A0C3DJM8_OIDMZ|nr:hypothetical protein OIDMADRAFT_162173 [Oidiodendron maius Zn]